MSLAERLAPYYTDFRVAERVMLTGHSHQAWPNVALRGTIDAYELAARHADDKWAHIAVKTGQLRAQIAAWIGAAPDEIALGASTHDLFIRALSCFTPLREIVTTSAEFHSARRQLKRLAEAGITVSEVPVAPLNTLAERLIDRITSGTTVAYVSDTLFTTGMRVPGLEAVAQHCHARGVEFFVDAYHSIGVVPFESHQYPHAWILGGGYKYLQLGEGNCFLRLPEHAQDLRPVITGWFASGDCIEDETDAVTFATGGDRFAGSTYDPTAHLRALAVGDFFQEQGLTIGPLHQNVVRQLDLLKAVLRDQSGQELAGTATAGRGGFLSIRTIHAAEHVAYLRAQGIFVDHRGPWLRLGPAPYVTDEQLSSAATILGRRLRTRR